MVLADKSTQRQVMQIFVCIVAGIPVMRSEYMSIGPWDWYIYLHEWLMFMGNLGRYIYIYISYMDGKELLNGDDVDCQHMDEASKCLIATWSFLRFDSQPQVSTFTCH